MAQEGKGAFSQQFSQNINWRLPSRHRVNSETYPDLVVGLGMICLGGDWYGRRRAAWYLLLIFATKSGPVRGTANILYIHLWINSRTTTLYAAGSVTLEVTLRRLQTNRYGVLGSATRLVEQVTKYEQHFVWR